MIRGLLLILDPAYNWEKIAKAQRGFLFVTVLHLLPLLALTLAIEGYCLQRFGERYDEIDNLVHPDRVAVIRYCLTEAIFGLIVAFPGTMIVRKVFNASSNVPYTFMQCYTLIAYGISPYYLLRVIDGIPYLRTWFVFGVGVALIFWVLYQGVPLLLRAHVPSAFGLYLSISTIIGVLLGLGHALAVFILRGEIDWEAWGKFFDDVRNFKF